MVATEERINVPWQRLWFGSSFELLAYQWQLASQRKQIWSTDVNGSEGEGEESSPKICKLFEGGSLMLLDSINIVARCLYCGDKFGALTRPAFCLVGVLDVFGMIFLLLPCSSVV